MNKFVFALAAIPAAVMASPASAQNMNAGGAVALQNRIANLEARIDTGIEAGVIDRTEARNLRRQVRDLRQLEMSYSQNGLTRQERTTLQQRVRTVRDQVRLAGGSGWSNRYGWNDADLDRDSSAYGDSGYDDDRYGNQGQARDYSYDRYGNRAPAPAYSYDRNGNRTSSPPVEYDRYGNRVTVDYDDRGRYDNAPAPRSGGLLGNVLGGGAGGILGSILGNGGLNVGDLITGAMGNVLGRGNSPRYQDRQDVYFRTDGERVYEIDARTNRVIRVHAAR